MISVLMSSFNENKHILNGAIDSVLNQKVDEPFELILVIDNPNNVELIDWIENSYSNFEEIKIVKNPTNLGLSHSLNIAIDKSIGQYICRMDADDISLPSRLQKQLDYLTSNDLDLIGGRMQVISQSGEPMYITPKLPSSPVVVEKASRWNNCLMHPTWFGTRNVFLQHYRNVPFCEDYDFQLRSIISGFKLGNIDDVILKYRISDNGISRSNLYRQYLFQKYLSKQFSDGNIAEIDLAQKYVTKKFDPNKAKKYIRSSDYWNEGLKYRSNRLYLNSYFSMLKAMLNSCDFANKMLRLLMAAHYGSKE